MYDAIQQRLADYDVKFYKGWRPCSGRNFVNSLGPPVKNPQKAKNVKKRGEEPLREALFRMSGVDLTGRDAIGVETVQVVLSEYGPDLSRFPTEKQFVSHVTLVSHKPMSGGQPVRKCRRSSASTRVAAALRMAAVTLRNSATALGAYYRKMARRLGGDVAVFATARKLATLIYRLLRWGSRTSMRAQKLSKDATKRPDSNI
jgi:hypothetical protein